MNFIYIISYNLPFFDEYCRICGLPLNNIEDIYNQINNNFNIEWMKEILFLYYNKEYIIHSYDGFGRFIIEGNIDDIPSQFIEKNENYNKLFFCNSIYNKSLNNCLVHKKCINRSRHFYHFYQSTKQSLLLRFAQRPNLAGYLMYLLYTLHVV